MTKHVCTNATLAGGRVETDKKGNIVAIVYTCTVCGAQSRRKA